MSAKKKVLYIQTSGVETPERTYAPFILGATAKAMDMDASIFFGIKGVTILQKGQAEKITLPQPFGALKDAIALAAEAGVPFLVCEESARMLGIDLEEGFIEGVKIVCAPNLNSMVVESDAVMTF
ncbi:MAG: DsrE family protein [Thermodesulfobacteriota bacterium]